MPSWIGPWEIAILFLLIVAAAVVVVIVVVATRSGGPKPHYHQHPAVGCPGCGAMIGAGCAYCPACGRPLAKTGPDTAGTAPTERFCGQCGRESGRGDLYCPGCGAQLSRGVSAGE